MMKMTKRRRIFFVPIEFETTPIVKKKRRVSRTSSSLVFIDKQKKSVAN